MGSTKIELVKDLQNVLIKQDLTQKKVHKIYEIINRAKKGEYHDFESKNATPKLNLHLDLLDVPLPEIDQKMQTGAYDDEHSKPEDIKQLEEEAARLEELLIELKILKK